MNHNLLNTSNGGDSHNSGWSWVELEDMQPNCSKCGKEMDAGFIIDRGHGQSKNLPVWIEGAPERSFWCGLKTGERANLEVQTYRCAGCGLLESYAIKPAQ